MIPSTRIVLLASLLAVAAACNGSAPADAPPLPDGTFPTGGGGGSGVCDRDGDGFQAPACGGLDCDDGRASAHPGADEVCGNALDDDCDGVVDEGCGCTPGDMDSCWEGDTAKRGVGACSDGVRRCGANGAWGACSFAVTPAPEGATCDGIDSDCDGSADPPSCGACPPGAVEICGNGLDDDCDGKIDPAELCTGSCDDLNPRADSPGNLACCLRHPPAIYEFECHEAQGLDACADRACLDLDGSLDTRCSKQCDGSGCLCGRRQASGQLVAVADCGFLTPCSRLSCGGRQNQPCYSGPPSTLGIGICHGGAHSCAADGEGREAWTACEGEITPGSEVCGNGLDDDCDGLIDEADGATGRRCPARSCAAGATELCGNGLDDDCDGFADEGCAATSGRQVCWTGPLEARAVGPCKDGAQLDEGGFWGPCKDEVLPAPEVCGDGIDSDCDGLGGPNQPEEPSCCVPQTETCNGVDDDCDGMADEGLLDRCGMCPGTGSCSSIASFDDAGDCTREGRSCAGVEPSPFDPSLITIQPGEIRTAAPVLYATLNVTSPFDYRLIKLDASSGEVLWYVSFGTTYTAEAAAAADGSVWVRHFYNVEHFSSDGTRLCRTDSSGTDFMSGLAPDPSGDMWLLWSPVSGYAVRRYAANDVVAEQSPGVPWPDGIPRCAVIDLDPAGAGTDIKVPDYGTIVVDGKSRLWSLTANPFVWDDGAITHLASSTGFFTAPVLAPDGSLLVGWPLRRIDTEGFLAGDSGAVKPLGSYGFNVANQQGLEDGTVVALYNEYPKNPRVVHVDPATGLEIDHFEVPPSGAQFVFDNIVVDAAGQVWTGIGTKAFRLDLATGIFDTFEPGGEPSFGPHSAGGGESLSASTGTWTQVVDAGTFDAAWGELSWESMASRGDRVSVAVRFADDPQKMDASTVVCGPFASSPADLSGCSKGLRYARVEIQLRGTGQPVAGNVRITWNRP